MQFHFLLFNHCAQGQNAIGDIVEIVGQQFLALGHHVSKAIDPLFATNGINVVLESFADPNYPALPQIAEAHARGCRFLYIATEEPTESGAFNNATDDPAMRDRQAAFAEAAQYCDGIVHLVPGDHITAWYGRYAPAAYAELGYAPGLLRDDGSEPDCDFGFFGKLTVRRRQMMRHLSTLGSVVTEYGFVPGTQRDREMRRARVIVQILETDDGAFSSSRCNTALSIGRPVVAEPHRSPGVWREIVHLSPTIDGFYEDARTALSGWRGLHRIQFEQFKERLAPEKCIGASLRKIGIL